MTSTIPTLRGAPLARSWFWTVTAAEFVGFAVPACVGATALGAVTAYAIGLVPSTFAGWIGGQQLAVLIVGAGLLGAVLLASIGTAQWLVLRRHVAWSASWIGTTAVAWLIGLAVFLGFATPLWQPGQPLALTVIIGIGGGLLMAATTSLITGLALRRLLK